MSFDILGVFLQLSFDENVEKKAWINDYSTIWGVFILTIFHYAYVSTHNIEREMKSYT